ncbi:hypothetical protein IMSAGC022_00266 [Alistipes sp.]|nr:hypothetical protein IMSAGC022_00266 [Alistipes sp.]
MKKIYKLVLKSYLGPLLITFFIVQFVLMMNFVWRYIDDLVGKGLDVSVIIELIACATANMIPLGLPLAMLLSAIMAMGNLGESYELLAMKSAGMSLPKILRPLLVIVGGIAVGSFFIVNNLVPFANQRMFEIFHDIRQQRQELEFKDGLFFNDLEGMSIRVGKQDDDTRLLHDVLIFDTRSSNGDMTTTVADSGYIKMSDDKNYLYVTLFEGETYEQTRGAQWYDRNGLRHHLFERQDGTIPLSNLSQSDKPNRANEAQTRNMSELQVLIDSLQTAAEAANSMSYAPLIKEQIFVNDISVLPGDSIRIDKSRFKPIDIYDSIAALGTRDRYRVYNAANNAVRNSRGIYSFDEQSSKYTLTQLYRSRNEWHRKLALPISIFVFFLIGAPLGAIIRKGGLGTPIVISVIFFVIYYVISLTGEKLAKEGAWDSLYGMWLPIFILSPVALYLTRKATNDSSLLDTDWYEAQIKRLRRKIKSRFKKQLRWWHKNRPWKKRRKTKRI